MIEDLINSLRVYLDGVQYTMVVLILGCDHCVNDWHIWSLKGECEVTNLVLGRQLIHQPNMGLLWVCLGS